MAPCFASRGVRRDAASGDGRSRGAMHVESWSLLGVNGSCGNFLYQGEVVRGEERVYVMSCCPIVPSLLLGIRHVAVVDGFPRE